MRKKTDEKVKMKGELGWIRRLRGRTHELTLLEMGFFKQCNQNSP